MFLEVGEQRDQRARPRGGAGPNPAEAGGNWDGREQRSGEPDPQLAPRPDPDDVHQLPGRREGLGGRRQVERRSGGLRVEGHAGDRLGHVIDRHDVHVKAGAHREDPKSSGQVQPQRCIDRVEVRDGAGPRVPDDHARPSDRDRQGGRHRRSDQHLSFVLALLVRVQEAEPVRGGTLVDRPGSTAGHVGGRDMDEPLEAVDGVDLTGELEDVAHPFHVGRAEVLDRRVEPEVGGRMDDDVNATDEITVDVVRQAQSGGSDVAGHGVHVPPDRCSEVGQIPPRTCQEVLRLRRIRRHDQDDELHVRLIQQELRDVGPDEPRATGEEDHAAHGSGFPQPAPPGTSGGGSRLRSARSRCSR